LIVVFFSALKHFDCFGTLELLLLLNAVGLGSGVGSALFADIARVTSSDERTAVMSVFMSMRQIGLLFGMSHYLRKKISI